MASVCRPDLTFRFAFAAQFPKPEIKDSKILNKVIQECLDTPEMGLKFVKLELHSMHMALFIDASFAGNSNYSSQLGYVLCLMDKHGTGNIIHYGSAKSKRIVRSVLSAELYGMVYGFDNASVMRNTLEDFLGRKVKLSIYTDSKCLFDALISLNTTTEKRLLIDLSMLRQCYERREITEVFWLPGDQNPADALTKDKPCGALRRLMITNKIRLSPTAWIERDSKKPFSYE